VHLLVKRNFNSDLVNLLQGLQVCGLFIFFVMLMMYGIGI